MVGEINESDRLLTKAWIEQRQRPNQPRDILSPRPKCTKYEVQNGTRSAADGEGGNLPPYRRHPKNWSQMRIDPSEARAVACKVVSYAFCSESFVNPDDRPVIPIETKRANKKTIDQGSYCEHRANC